MNELQRYAIYYAPRPGALANLAGHWLGRAIETGAAVAQRGVPGLPVPLAGLTADARRYGFHGTIRAPFRPRPGSSADAVGAAAAGLAARLAPVRCAGLRLENLQGFLALTPVGCEAALLDLAALVVEATDPLRSPLNPEEIARRRPATLTSRQRELLECWGYPHVMEEFRFHLTVTDRLLPDQLPMVTAAAAAHFAPVLHQPFAVEDLCLYGEDSTGTFHFIHRYALSG